MSRFRALLACSVVGLISWLLGTSPLVGQDETPVRTTMDGVYTQEQADEGRRVYQRSCARCHTLDWYTGDIVRAWEGGTVYGMFALISTTMPQDNPSSLQRRQYAEVLAYILSVNGMPPGDEALSTGRSRLNAIVFRFPEKEEKDR